MKRIKQFHKYIKLLNKKAKTPAERKLRFQKYSIIFITGMVETFLYTWYLLEVNKGNPVSASILMMFYMIIYLGIISFAIKSADTLMMLIIYAISCGIGTYIRMILEGIIK